MSSSTSSCCFRGPPGLATPYVRQECFQTAYAPGPRSNDCGCCGQQSSGVNCVRTFGTRGSCLYNAECQTVGNRCRNGRCGTFESNNPRVVKTQDAANDPNTYLVRDPSGEQCVVTPLLSTRGRQTEPQCSTCLKTIWQCDRLRNTQPQAYEQCKRFSKCFLYDTVREDGTIIPLSVRMTPECMGAARAALEKCATRCGQCQPTDALARDGGAGRMEF